MNRLDSFIAMHVNKQLHKISATALGRVKTRARAPDSCRVCDAAACSARAPSRPVSMRFALDFRRQSTFITTAVCMPPPSLPRAVAFRLSLTRLGARAPQLARARRRQRSIDDTTTCFLVVSPSTPCLARARLQKRLRVTRSLASPDRCGHSKNADASTL